MSRQQATITGRLPNELANATSDLIHAFLQRGMEIDEVCCVVVGVAADYARGVYGADYLIDLAEIVKAAADRPLPELVAGGPEA